MAQELKDLHKMGPKRLECLRAAGIHTVRHLLLRLPVDYRDLSAAKPLAALRPGEQALVEVHRKGGIQAGYFKGLHMTKCRVGDESGYMTAVWFNQPWVKKRLGQEGPLRLYGRVDAKHSGLQLTCPSFESARGILPVYAPVPGIPAAVYRGFVEQALDGVEKEPERLPASLRLRRGLVERAWALRQAHAPRSMEDLTAARRRLAFEELLLYQVALRLLRGRTKKGVPIPVPEGAVEAYFSHLSFAPTGAQARVLREIAEDLQGQGAMARMVQGDVGCGKTAVAFGALVLCAQAGYQGAMMAPTEVLARQHYEEAQRLMQPLGIRAGLLTGSLGIKEKRLAHEAIACGAWQVVIGTHALISEAVSYKDLGLVVTDEQHRFGVRQRALLSRKGTAPNVLVMSATPIPRTLSLILYGDLDISIIDELPPGRVPVKTHIVPEEKRGGMYGFIRDQVAEGRQAYIVCPLVEESEAIEARPAEMVYEELREGPLKGLRLGLAHGKMKSAELAEALERFAAGETDVLVATTVIEVGVNVPNATVMVIENAERFGLAQLHQLRGRVGRADHTSWCFLMAQSNERLDLLTRTGDGFVIAQRDMELRGVGEILGTRQSGAMLQGIGMSGMDTRLLKEAHDEARELMSQNTEEALLMEALAKERFGDEILDAALN